MLFCDLDAQLNVTIFGILFTSDIVQVDIPMSSQWLYTMRNVSKTYNNNKLGTKFIIII